MQSSPELPALKKRPGSTCSGCLSKHILCETSNFETSKSFKMNNSCEIPKRPQNLSCKTLKKHICCETFAVFTHQNLSKKLYTASCNLDMSKRCASMTYYVTVPVHLRLTYCEWVGWLLRLSLDSSGSGSAAEVALGSSTLKVHTVSIDHLLEAIAIRSEAIAIGLKVISFYDRLVTLGVADSNFGFQANTSDHNQQIESTLPRNSPQCKAGSHLNHTKTCEVVQPKCRIPEPPFFLP